MDVETAVLSKKDTLLDKELRFVIYIQKKLSPWYDYPALIVHYFFRDDVLMLLGPITTFLFNYYIGTILALTCLFVEIYAGVIKWACRLPRPLWMETNNQLVNRKGEWEQDYGFPSAHATIATSMATVTLLIYIDIKSDPQFMAYHDVNKDPNILLICFSAAIVLSLLTGLSRIYFAVHYPRDVIFGYIFGPIGGLLMYYSFKKTSDINEWASIGIGIVLTSVTVLLMIVIRPLCPQDRVQMPIWEANALKAWNARTGQNLEKHPIGLHPRAILRYIPAYGLLFGLWLGNPIYRLLHNGQSYHECQEWTKTKGIRFGIGLPGVLFFVLVIYGILPKISKNKIFLYTTEAIFGIAFGLWLSLIPQTIFYAAAFNQC